MKISSHMNVFLCARACFGGGGGGVSKNQTVGPGPCRPQGWGIGPAGDCQAGPLTKSTAQARLARARLGPPAHIYTSSHTQTTTNYKPEFSLSA